jgi:hypothetical protein
VFSALDFVERYNRFDSETNSSDFPRLSLFYDDSVNGMETNLKVSEFGSKRLGNEFKNVARNSEIRRLVESAINQILRNAK